MVKTISKIKIIFTIAFLSVIWLLPEKIHAQKPESAESVFAKTVEAILGNSCLRKQNFGIKIHSLERNKTLYSVHSDRLFAPASNVKLLTTAMALKRLGPDYRFKTGLYATMPVGGEILGGDIYVKGFGDPNLVSEQMWLLVNELKNIPLRKVHGISLLTSRFSIIICVLKRGKKEAWRHTTPPWGLYRSTSIRSRFMLLLGKNQAIGRSW